jgi:hypothetical protein
MAKTSTLRVLSLGAGVQSTTLLLLACAGETEPLDAAIFADTGDEPQAVYDHLIWLEAQARAAGIPVYRVSAGNIREDLLAAVERGETRVGHIGQPPFYVKNPTPTAQTKTIDTLWGQQTVVDVSRDKGGRLWRKCTAEYKLAPIRRQVRILMQQMGARRVEQWLGISLDEVGRMKPSGVKYITNRFPLVERRWRRGDCLAWLADHGYPTPPKSACVLCPFHDNAYWRRLKETSPDEWERAVRVDAAIRRGLPGVRGEAYLHRQLVPLPLVDLGGPDDDGQLDLFLDECEGMCGI